MKNTPFIQALKSLLDVSCDATTDEYYFGELESVRGWPKVSEKVPDEELVQWTNPDEPVSSMTEDRKRMLREVGYNTGVDIEETFEPLDCENFEVLSLKPDQMIVSAGGDWQSPMKVEIILGDDGKLEARSLGESEREEGMDHDEVWDLLVNAEGPDDIEVSQENLGDLTVNHPDRPAPLEPRRIGQAYNTYGGIWAKSDGEKCFWGVMDYDDLVEWEEIPLDLYQAMREFDRLNRVPVEDEELPLAWRPGTTPPPNDLHGEYLAHVRYITDKGDEEKEEVTLLRYHHSSDGGESYWIPPAILRGFEVIQWTDKPVPPSIDNSQPATEDKDEH